MKAILLLTTALAGYVAFQAARPGRAAVPRRADPQASCPQADRPMLIAVIRIRRSWPQTAFPADCGTEQIAGERIARTRESALQNKELERFIVYNHAENALMWWFRSPPYRGPAAVADFGTIIHTGKQCFASVLIGSEVRKAADSGTTNFRTDKDTGSIVLLIPQAIGTPGKVRNGSIHTRR
jgi:hypothetical protein